MSVENINIPPQDIEAEQSALGAMIIDNAMIPVVTQILKPDMFYNEANAIIYQTIMAMSAENKPIDPVTLKERLEAKQNLDRVGGISYLATVCDIVPTPLNAPKYAAVVKEKHILRQIIRTLRVHADRAFKLDTPIEILAALNAELNDLAAISGFIDPHVVPKACVDIIQDMVDAANNIPRCEGIPTGFEHLDKDILIPNGEITVIAARPGAGKTSMACQIADHNALVENPMLYISLEMDAKALIRRVVAQRTGIPTSVINRGPIPHEQDIVCRALENIAVSWKIISRQSRDIDDIIHLIKYEYSRKRYAGIIIDLFSLITIDAIGKDFSLASRINKKLLSIAQELNVPLISVVQINRDVDQNKKPRTPRLSNLKGTGSHEEDAALVILIHRDEDNDNADIIVAKNRFGPRGVYTARFNGPCQRFEIGAKQ